MKKILTKSFLFNRLLFFIGSLYFNLFVMRKLRLPFVALLLFLLGTVQLSAQRVIAYHQGEKNDNIENWYWDYVTDVNYCFAQIHTNGTIQFYAQGADAFTAQNKIDNFNEFKQKM